MALADNDLDLCVDVAVSMGPRDARWVQVRLPAGASVRDALLSCGLLETVEGLSTDAINAGKWVVAVWGRKQRLDHLLAHQDRVELLRPLLVDPKEARRLRYQDHLKKWPKGSQRIRPRKKATAMVAS